MDKLNGKDSGGYDKSVTVNAADVERSMLEVSLQAVRDNPNIRRPDGRKSPYMLCAEEALRLRTVMRQKGQELEMAKAYGDSLAESFDRHIKSAAIIATAQQQSRWFRLGRWMGFYR